MYAKYTVLSNAQEYAHLDVKVEQPAKGGTLVNSWWSKRQLKSLWPKQTVGIPFIKMTSFNTTVLLRMRFSWYTLVFDKEGQWKVRTTGRVHKKAFSKVKF